MKLFFLSLVLFCSSYSFAQLSPIGSWTDHFPFNRGKSIEKTDNLIFCATESGLFTFSLLDNSIEKFSKVNFLNDIDLSLIAYSEEFKTLIVTYENGNIDLIIDNQIFNIPFVKLSNTGFGPNEIKISGNLAYLSFDFGIIVLDIVKREIKETYQFGNRGEAIKVNSTQIIGNTIYAATDNGFYKAELGNNLLDFNSWVQQLNFSTNSVKKLFEINNQLALVVKMPLSDSGYVQVNPNEFSVIGEFNSNFINLKANGDKYDIVLEGRYLQLDNMGNKIHTFSVNTSGYKNAINLDSYLYVLKENGPLDEVNFSSGEFIRTIKPNGPQDKIIFDMALSNGVLWTVNGSHDFAYNNTFNNAVIQRFQENEWDFFVPFFTPSLNGAFDIVSVTINPQNPNVVFFSTWGQGMFQFTRDESFKILQDTNTNNALQLRKALDSWIGTGEAAYDSDGNLWIVNTYNRRSLVVRRNDGSWKSFDFSSLVPNEETAIYDIAISNEGYKWLTFPKQNRIIVFDDNGTINQTNDDRLVELKAGEGEGNVPGIRGIKIEKDRNGLMWIGTSDGIAVHLNPANVFDENNNDFSRIIFFDGENNEVVLKNATIKEIAVDGANRKWIGTESSGVLLLSEDGKETILEFNVDNSPLPSNIINAIAIDDETGEVYIATTGGLVSYRSDVVGGKQDLNEVKIFPNPVRPSYSGPITISGLMDNSTVKITDLTGNLVVELKSNGGSVLWDGMNFDGKRVATGMYLIFSSASPNLDDIETNIGKIMFIK